MRFREFVAGRHPFMEVNEAALGLASEAGEIAQLARKLAFEGALTYDTDLAVEAGDVLHYLELLNMILGTSMEDLELLNMIKLAEREQGREEDMMIWRRLEERERGNEEGCIAGVIEELMERYERGEKWPWE